jgi:hypothetical protein
MFMENIEIKIRHLEMIQAVITRMASNSFMLKGWAVTLIAGVFVLASRDSNPVYFLIAYIPVVLFWFLDSYYLQLERKFRVHYKDVSNQKEPDLSFSMKIPGSCSTDKTLYHQSFFSISEIGFYLPTAILVAGVVLISNLC